jgi:hypothetical protein
VIYDGDEELGDGGDQGDEDGVIRHTRSIGTRSPTD